MEPTTTTTISQRVNLRRKSETLTERICRLTTLDQRQAAFDAGWNLDRAAYLMAGQSLADCRASYGFLRKHVALLSAPDSNTKLDKSTLRAYGLTLQSAITELLDGSRVNACPMFGHCTQVCVLDLGHGGDPRVQRARDYRTELFGTDPISGIVLMAYELRKGVNKLGEIAFRPDVDSDLDWLMILGDRLQTMEDVSSYGYSKRSETIHETGLTFQSFSWSERATADDYHAVIETGIPLAVVTNREIGAPIKQWHPTLRVVDADKSDEWQFERNVIGDLSLKGPKRAEMIERASSAPIVAGPLTASFVQNLY